MAVADDLEASARRADDDQPGARSTPRRRPRRSHGDITPTELHYVRSNFAVPDARRHARDRRRGRATRSRSRSTTCARCRRSSAPSRSSAPATAASTMRPLPDRRAVGRLRRLHRPLEGRAPARGARAGAARGGRRRGPLRGRRPRARTTCSRCCRDRPVRPRASCARCRSPHATDPAAEILIAYEMNGEPLDARPRRALPADRARTGTPSPR